MAEQNGISEKSRRVAKNTLLLYFRMLLLMFIGLFTSRIVLQTLGVEDYGTYNAVAGMVGLFSIVINGITTAISRFLTCEIGKGDKHKVKEVFAASLSTLLILCAFVILLVETLGMWLLDSQMTIPADRMDAAHVILHCSAITMVFSLLSIPYTSIILANEQMKAYAVISLLEGFLKISVATFLYISTSDKLIVYAVLMLATAIIVRASYTAYCRRHFEETKTRPVWNRHLILEISGFAGWNAASSGIFIINTQGLNLLTNIFFGVSANAARGVAAQIEGIVKQFVNNVIVAINPQITKSYVAENKDYSFSLVSRGSKYAYLIMLCFIAPALFEMQTILELWLGVVPEQASLFCKLTLICTLLDLLMTTYSTIVLADGRIKRFYMTICSISALVFPLVWIAFKAGAPAETAYIIFILSYIVLDITKLIFIHNITGYPYSMFFKDVIAKVAMPTGITLLSCATVVSFIPEPTVSRMFITAIISCSAFAVSCYCFALTAGEREFLLSKIRKK